MTLSVFRWFVSQPAAMFYALVGYDLYLGLGSPGGVPALAALIISLLFPCSVALWLLADARRRQRSLPYDLGMLVFLSWPVSVPLYLFATRGWRAFAPLAGFLLLYLAASFCRVIPFWLHALHR